jgi:PAP2 superfamily
MAPIFEGNEGNEGNAGNSGNAFSARGGWYFADRINLPLVTECDTGPNATVPPKAIGQLTIVNQKHFFDRNWSADWFAWLALNDFASACWTDGGLLNPTNGKIVDPSTASPDFPAGKKWVWPAWPTPLPTPPLDWTNPAAPPIDWPTELINGEIDRLVTAAANERADALAEILSQANEFISYILNMLTARPGSHPQTTRVLNIASLIAMFVSMYYKGQYQRPRPSQLSPALLPPIMVPGHASFPSGHSTQAHLMALCMGDVLSPLPEQATLIDDLWTLADCIARNREIAGLHYPSDTDAGKAFAYWIHYLLNNSKGQDNYTNTVTAAKAEWPPGDWS